MLFNCWFLVLADFCGLIHYHFGIRFLLEGAALLAAVWCGGFWCALVLALSCIEDALVPLTSAWVTAPLLCESGGVGTILFEFIIFCVDTSACSQFGLSNVDRWCWLRYEMSVTSKQGRRYHRNLHSMSALEWTSCGLLKFNWFRCESCKMLLGFACGDFAPPECFLNSLASFSPLHF